MLTLLCKRLQFGSQHTSWVAENQLLISGRELDTDYNFNSTEPDMLFWAHGHQTCVWLVYVHAGREILRHMKSNILKKSGKLILKSYRIKMAEKIKVGGTIPHGIFTFILKASQLKL